MIQQIAFEHRRRYGYRRISAELRRRGMLVITSGCCGSYAKITCWACSRGVCGDHGFRSRVRGLFEPRQPNELTGMNQFWVADITYIRLKQEFVYLAVVLDAFSARWWDGRWTVRWRPVADHGAAAGHGPTTAVAGLGASLGSRRAVRVRRYAQILQRHQMIPSMSRPANPYDNASCESFMKTLKREEIYANEYRDLDHFSRISKRSSNSTTIGAGYIRHWATDRRRSSSGMRVQRSILLGRQ